MLHLTNKQELATTMRKFYVISNKNKDPEQVCAKKICDYIINAGENVNITVLTKSSSQMIIIILTNQLYLKIQNVLLFLEATGRFFRQREI